MMIMIGIVLYNNCTVIKSYAYYVLYKILLGYLTTSSVFSKITKRGQQSPSK